MDLLIEKDNQRTYLSRYKVITTSFEESSPSVKRNNTQIQYRNGNVDFGGWNESKKIDYVGYYRADDLEDEEYLRERIYALLSDPEGYYITQLKNDNDNSFERPGENTGDYFEKQVNRPSHKRFYVYASSLETELVGSYGGHVLYKISATFTTMKLPYGESVPRDLDIKPNVPYIGENLLLDTAGDGLPNIGGNCQLSGGATATSNNGKTIVSTTSAQGEFFYRFMIPKNDEMYGFEPGNTYIISGELLNSSGGKVIIRTQIADGNGAWQSLVDAEVKPGKFSAKITIPLNSTGFFTSIQQLDFESGYEFSFSEIKIESGATATPYSPAPSDKEYNAWYTKIYYNTDNLVIPYAGTVPCSQLEQGFIVEFTAKTSGANLSISINGIDFIAPGNVNSGDVFKLSGYEYLRNGISIVKATNKAYFKLLPGVANKISSSLKGEIKILNFQNLYA